MLQAKVLEVSLLILCAAGVKTGLPPAGLQDKGCVKADAKRSAVMLEEYEAQESVQRQWEKNYFESQQKLEQYKVCI